MKTYQDLSIKGSHQQLVAFMDSLTAARAPGWNRDRDREAKIGPPNLACFACAATAGRDSACVWIAWRSEQELWVSNIVPIDKQALSYDSYNTVLMDFFTHLATPAAQESGAILELSAGEVLITDLISRVTFGLLQGFSRAANKSTGSLHPMDEDRWMDFVIAAHRERAVLSATDLGRWLTEEEGWRGEIALDLMAEYESYRTLLRRYDTGSR